MKVEWAYNLSTVLNSEIFAKKDETPIILLSRDSPTTNGKQFTTVEYNDKNIKKLLASNFHGYEFLYRELPRKFYVDVDLKPTSALYQKYTTEKMIQYVIEILDKIMSHVFPQKKDLLKNPNIFVSDLDNQRVKKSAHIIFPNFILKNLDEIIHIKLILKSYLHHHKIELPHSEIVAEHIIDLNVYRNNQNVRLPFQSKKDDTTRFIPLKRTSLKNHFVGVYEPIYEKDLSMSDIPLHCLCKEIGEKLYNQKYPENAGLSNKKDKTTIIDFDCEVHFDLLDYDPHTPRENIISHDHENFDFVKFLVSCVPNHDCGQSWKVWWCVGQALRNIGTEMNAPDKYLDLWILWSSQCSTYYSNYIQDCMREWKITKNEHHICKPRLIPKIGFLKCLAFWYHPREVNSFLMKKDVQAFFTLEESDKKIFDKVDVYNTQYCSPFELDCYDIIVSQAPMGSGKTFQMKELIKQKNKYNRILVLSPRQTFSKEKHAEFKEICPDFRHYQDPCLVDNPDWTKIDKLVVQVESLVKFPDFEYSDMFDLFRYDLVILDEIESILFQFSSSTHTNISKAFHVFYQIITKSKKIVLADAFITKRSIQFCKSLKERNNKIKYKLDINTYNPNKDTKAQFLGIANTFVELREYKEIFKEHIKNQLREKKKICVCIASKSFKNNIIDAIIKDSILEVSEILEYDADSSDIKTQDFNDVNRVWKDPVIKLVIYTTKITVGINFNVPDVFHSIYIYGSIKCPNVRDILQAHFRVRHIKDKVVYVLINCACFDHWLQSKHLTQNFALQYVEDIYKNYEFSEFKLISDMFSLITSSNILETNLGFRCYLEVFKHLICLIGYEVDLNFQPIQKISNLSENKTNELSFSSRYIQNYREYKLTDIKPILSRRKKCLATEKDKIILDCVHFYEEYLNSSVDSQAFENIIISLKSNSFLKLLKENANTLCFSLWDMWETDLYNCYRSNNDIKRYIKNMSLERKTSGNKYIRYNKKPLNNFADQENEKRLFHVLNICRILKLRDSKDTTTHFGEQEILAFRDYYNQSEIKSLFKIRQKRREEDCILSYISIIRQIFKYWNGLHLTTIVKRKFTKKIQKKEYSCSLDYKSDSKENLVYSIFLQILKNDMIQMI